MSLNHFNQTLSINVRSSLAKKILIFFPHIIICFLLFIFLEMKGTSFIYFLLSVACIFLSVFYFVRLHLTQNIEKSVRLISYCAQGGFDIILKNDVRVKVKILSASFSSNFLIILNFENDLDKQYTALITPDSVSKEEFRKLKVLLKVNRLNKLND